MPHQSLWTLALALVPAGLMFYALGRQVREPQRVPVEIDRPTDRGTEPR